MKKSIFSKLMMGLLFVAAGFALTACGDDDNEEPVQPEAPATWATSYTVSVTVGPEMFEMVDITAHIAHPDGTVTEEAVVKEQTDWTMTGNSIPDKAGVQLSFVPKSGLDPDRVYHVAVKRSIRATSYKNGEVFSSLLPSLVETSSPLKGSQVEKYFTGRTIAEAAEINAEGHASSLDPKKIDFSVAGK